MTHKFVPDNSFSWIGQRCNDCGLPQSSHEKEVTVERPDDAIRQVTELSYQNSVDHELLVWLEHVEAELKELEATHAQCPREVSGDEVDDTVEVWAFDQKAGRNGWITVRVPVVSNRYIVKPRKTQTAEQMFRERLWRRVRGGTGDSLYVYPEDAIEVAKEVGLLREES